MSAPSTSSFSVITVTCYRRKIWLFYLFWQFIKPPPRPPPPLAPKTGASYAIYDWGPALERSHRMNLPRTQPCFQGSLLPALRSKRERDPGKRWSRVSQHLFCLCLYHSLLSSTSRWYIIIFIFDLFTAFLLPHHNKG